jgi:hypothetical protein
MPVVLPQQHGIVMVAAQTAVRFSAPSIQYCQQLDCFQSSLNSFNRVGNQVRNKIEAHVIDNSDSTNC